MYVNDLPLRINSVSEPVLFANDTSVLISSKNFGDFRTMPDLVHCHMIKWFATKLVLNLDKTNIMKFMMSNSPHSALCTGYEEKCIEEKAYNEIYTK
jgi:hypothetical protein